MANPKAPAILVMYAAKDILESGDALATAVNKPDLKIRWARNRYTSREERPCFAIAFVSDEPIDDGSVPTTFGELVRRLQLDLIVDLEVETEASTEAQEAQSASILDYDPSGLDDLMFVLLTGQKLLRAATEDPLRDTTDLGRRCDWIQDVSIDDDEDLPDDDGRLVGRINVIYRTSDVDPMVLIEREV